MDTSPTPPTKYQCLHCAKKYIRISSMEKHKLLCDLEHSVYEVSLEPKINIRFLNDYEAWYRNKKEWDELIESVGFKKVNMKRIEKKTPTKYYYSLYTK